MSGLSHKETPFVFNMPYIALDALLVAEEYSFKNKINKLAKELVLRQKLNGSWSIKKLEINETTWVTAEAIIVLGEVENKFVNFQMTVLMPRRMKIHLTATVILSVIASVLLLSYFVQGISPNNNIIRGLPSAIIGFLGIVSSVITIVEMLRK